MKKMWNWMLIVMVSLFFAIPSLSFALDGPVITTGGTKGNYFKVGNKLKGLIGGEVLSSKGSVENMDRIMKGEANVGIVQMDAYAWYIAEHPEAEDRLEVMGPLYEECVYLAVNKNGPVQDEDDLQNEGVTVAVGKKGSGTAVTWDFMRQLEPEYKNAGTSFKGGIRALGKLAAKPNGKLNAVMWVTKPNLEGKLAQTVLKNENLEFVDLDDKDLNDDYEPTGKPIYNFKKISASGGLFGGSVKTICVEAVIIADADADEDMLDNISDMVLNYKSSLLN